ncbi:MAG: hypothetical protein K6E67_03060, partial [Prevotella sp.]|nr:hypothetical protein [Prevotella sp.]
MKNRKDRLNEAFEHLRIHHGVFNKSVFAEKLRVAKAGLYSAMNGNEAYLTDSLFQKICAAFPGVFNLDYLLDGTGTLLAEQIPTPEPQPAIQSNIDPSSAINAALAVYVQYVDTLKANELKKD